MHVYKSIKSFWKGIYQKVEHICVFVHLQKLIWKDIHQNDDNDTIRVDKGKGPEFGNSTQERLQTFVLCFKFGKG